MRPALLLDRDGILNRDIGYPHRIADIALMPGAVALCRAGMRRGLALVIVTNQAGIGRGLYTEDAFHALTRWMLGVLARKGVAVTGVEYCPFHPTAGLGPYRIDSPRRKPAPGMILDAASRHGLDLPASILVGDRATDVRAARAAGVGAALLVPASVAEAAAAPGGTVVLPSVRAAARWVAGGGAGCRPAPASATAPPVALRATPDERRR